MADAIKRLVVLGSTGSIGQQTLDVVRTLSERFKVTGLAAGQNLELLSRQIIEFKPQFVSHNSKGNLPPGDYTILPIEEIARLPQADIVVIATSGVAGLMPTFAAVKAGKTIALANKESLVMAGGIITSEAEKRSAEIRPVDSEHSAIWQCLRGENLPVKNIILTASGGPFRSFSKSQLEKVTVEQALNHPSWKMGKKVTVDSATLMNKGLEVIEARWLFNMPFDKIRVVIHPQSIIHSMVEFADCSVKAQLSVPDMRLPIQYALSYPERLENPSLNVLNWGEIASLNFGQPDMDVFPCLRLATEAGTQGGTCPAVLCASDEAAVGLFLAGKIKFTDIAGLVERTLNNHRSVTNPGLDEIVHAGEWAAAEVNRIAEKG